MNRDGIRVGVAIAALLMSITTPLATAQVANAQVARPAAPPVSPLGGEGYTPVLPARLLDTRPGFSTVDGLEAGGGIVGAGDTVDVTVLGRGGVPLTGVDSVVLHVTAVKQTVMGFVTVFPSGESRPTVSSLNPVPGAVSSNLVAVHVGTNGKVSLYNSAGTTHLIVDVEGWFPVGPTFHGLTPTRLLDTRGGAKVGPGGVLDLQVSGAGGVPVGTTSVALNVTVVGATTSTFVTVYPTGTALPATSNLNAQPGIIAANLVIGELSPAGKVRLYNANGSVHLIVDVMGYFGNGPGYTPIYPARVIDTRGGTPLGPNSTTVFHLTGIGGVPISGVGAVAFNLTATHQTARTYLTVYPHGSSQPLSSDLNPQPGVVAPNLVFGKVGPDGSLSVYNSSGTVDVIIDVVGWFPSNTEVLDDTATFTEDDPAATIDVLANDTDYDGGPVLIDYITPPANGTVVVVADTSVTYEPDADYCNSDTGTPDTFTYTLNGGATGTVSVDVTCVDDLPVAVADDATVAEDAAAAAIDVLANDTDVDGGPKAIDSVTQPGNGTVVITGGGTGVTYEPNADFCNSVSGPDDSFTYTLNGGSVATVTVTVTCVDDAPLAVADTASATEDGGSVAVAVLSNDTDIDGGPMVVASVTQPANGSVVITGGGTGVSYTPAANYCNNPPGTVLDTFTYTLNGGSSAGVTVTVDCVDDVPVAVIDHLILSEDSGETPTDVLANDVDVDGGPRLVTSVTQPANGTAAVVGGGIGVSYTPDADYCNSVSGPDDSFSYTLNGGSSANVTVTVTCVDDAPVAVADSATVSEDAAPTAIDVLANDTDVDGGPKAVALASQPTNGTVVITGGGTGLTYQPNANYCNNPPGTTLDTFGYSLNGGSVTIVTVTVTCADDAPIAVADSTTVTEDDPASAIDVLANDTDVDGGPKSVASVTQPAHGTVVITGGGTGVTYEPTANYCNDGVGGDPDTFDYTLNGGSSATVSVTVSCVDDAPIAVADAAALAEDDPATAIAVLSNDTDIDAGPKTVASVTQPAHGTVVITGGGTGLTYAPNANYCNSVSGPDDSFTYTLTPGGSSTTVTVTVSCVDDAPIAVADSATVTEDSGANAVDVLANDTDIDAGPKTVASVTQPANGTVVITGGGTGVDYTPGANYCNNPPGTVLDTFTYTLNGGSSATVTVTVDCVDDAPLAVGDAATLTEDDPATALDVLANDTDVDGGAKSVASVTQPAHGTVVITGGGTGVTYQPNADYCNSQIGGTADTFTYTLSPGGATGTASVTVMCVNDLPVAVADAVTIVEDATSVLIPALANDVDVDGDPIVFESLIPPMIGTATLSASDISYVPPADFCGDAQMAYTINGGSFAAVTVHVTCVDDLPNAADDTVFMNEDVPATAFPVLANDPDVDGGPKAIASVTQPANGTVVITGGGTGLTYEPDADYCNSHVGDPADTFTYTLTPAGTTPTATVSATVVCVDDAPTAVADSATVTEDSGATAIDVLANDTDIDGGVKVILPVTQPSHGTVVITGVGTGVTYEPALNYCNSVSGVDDSFTYTLNGVSTATVTVTVTCVDDAAQAVTDTATVTQNDPATAIDVLSNDVDVDGGAAYSIVSVTQPANGTVVITGGGTGLTYQPDFDYCNDSGPTTDDFSYTITGGSAGAVQVTVICLDDPPTAVADSATVSEDSGANALAVLANDTDADGGPISIASVTQPTNGAVVITGGGTGLTYAPTANYCNNPPGTTLDSFTYTLTPGGSSTTVTVTVDCVDDFPVAVSNGASMSEDAGQTFLSVLNNDTDIDGGPKFIVSATQGTHGSVFVEVGGGILAYTPDANYCNNPPGSPLDTFTYTLNGGSTTTVAVTVNCVDDDPVAVADGATVVEDSGVNAITVLANDTDVDAGPTSIASVTQPANGAVVITGGGTGLTYQPNANYCNNPPGSTLDTFTYSLTPGSSTATVTVTVTCVDDPPTAVGDIASVAEDALATTIPVMTNDSDIDAGPRSITSVTQPSHGTVVITGGGTGLTYKPAANYCNDQAPASTDDFTYTLTPGGSSATVAMTVTCVNDAPTALAPTYNAVANMSISVSAVDGVLAGAADTEGTTLTVSNLSAPSVAGSTLTLDTATGAFDFTPKPGYTGAITFSYKVCDAGIPLPSACTTTITATVNVGGPVIWFVDDTATAGGDGTLSKPFQTLTAAATAASATQHIFVFSGTYATGVTLKTDGWLIGQPITGSTFDALFSLSSTTFVQARPTLATGSVTIGGEVALGTNSKVRGIAINSPGKGLSGSSVNGVDVDQTSIGNTSSTGPALDLNTVGGTLLLSNVSQTGGATGISIATSTASVTVQAGTISSTTSKAIVLTGGSNTISLPASMTVTVSAGRALEVSGRTGGTLTIPGSFTATGGTGISLTSNTGATINLTGVLNLSTGTGDAFTATGGGTVTASDSTNVLATTTGTALNVANTTIGSSGLKFTSISAGTGASGPASGIILNTTGLGSLTVLGTGSANSGGTIQHTAGAGISLTSTTGPSFSWMKINNTAGSGVSGTGVNGFTFDHGNISTSGDAALEANIAFNNGTGLGSNITGTLTVTNSTLTSGFSAGLDVQGDAGTLANAVITGNTVDNPGSGTGAISISGTGNGSTSFSLTKATINGNNIIGAAAAGIQVSIGNSNPSGPGATAGILNDASNRIAITNNAATLDATGTNAIIVATSGGNSSSRTQANFLVQCNGLNTGGCTAPGVLNGSAVGTVVLIGNNGYSDMSGTVDNNRIDANHTPGGGGGNGIGGGNGVAGAGNSWTPSITLTVTNNVITDTDGNGILLVGRGTSGTAKYKVLNNNVAAPINAGGTARQGIRIDAGSTGSADDSVCLNISGNTSAGSNGALGIGLRKQGTVATTNDFSINGMAATATPGVEVYVLGLNPGAGGVDLISATSGFTNCSLP